MEGSFSLTKVHKVTKVCATWFGAASSDLSADMSDVTLANSNAKAIREANSFCQLPGTDGIYVTPRFVLPKDLCLVDDDDNDGLIIDLRAYQTIVGDRWSTVLRPVNNGKAMSIIKCTQDAANNFYLDNITYFV